MEVEHTLVKCKVSKYYRYQQKLGVGGGNKNCILGQSQHINHTFPLWPFLENGRSAILPNGHKFKYGQVNVNVDHLLRI